MSKKLVKWSKESKEFFDKAEDNSLVLDLVISHACASQTGKGFEQLVNSINIENIKRKVKKVVITDTSYLYRHTIPEFQKYSDQNIPTEWYLNNKKTIEKLTVPTELKSWVSDINTDEFKKWYKKIKCDFSGDKNGKNIVLDFRDKVMQEATIAAYKNNTSILACIDFILEEGAHICTLKNSVIIYPMPFCASIKFLITKYKLNLLHLYYKIVSSNSKRKTHNIQGLKMETHVFPFLIETLNANFFIINRFGNYIYKNNQLSNLVRDVPANIIDPEGWQVSMDIMKTNEQKVVEELYNGRYYLSVKAPLVVNGKVEGVMGLAVDITDRKRAEELKQKELLYNIAKKVVHDINSPIASLEIFKYLYAKKLPRDQREIIESSLRSIKNITQTLLSKYKSVQNKEKCEKKKKYEYYISPYTINEIIERKRYEYYDRELQIKYNTDKNNKFVFMRGNFSDFMRMITNLIDNAENAVEEKGKEGIIEVSYKVIGKEVDIRVIDNGIGMPKDMVEKINNGMTVGTTKKDGYGIGMEQILNTVEEMKCKMEVKSKEGKGTEFKLICDICEPPKWFAGKIQIRKGSVVVVLDDDIVIHNIWKKKFKEYEKDIEVKYFRKGSGAIKYINSIKEKKNVLLLTDYELGDEELINGINVIEKTNLKDSHVLVTSSYLSEIKEFEEKSDFLKICPKTYLNDITLVLAR